MREMECEPEECMLCGNLTGYSGEYEDSLYDDMGDGPYCDTCYDDLPRDPADEDPK